MKPQGRHEFTGSRNSEGSWKQKPDLISGPGCGCLLARPEHPQTSAGELPPGHPCQVPSSPLKSWIVTTFHEMELGNQSKTVWLKVILGNFWSKARSILQDRYTSWMTCNCFSKATSNATLRSIHTGNNHHFFLLKNITTFSFKISASLYRSHSQEKKWTSICGQKSRLEFQLCDCTGITWTTHWPYQIVISANNKVMIFEEHKGPALWYSGLSHHLQCWHPMWLLVQLLAALLMI